MADESCALNGAVNRALAGAALWLAVGCGVIAVAGVYVLWVSTTYLKDRFPFIAFIFICAIGAIPLIVGLPIVLHNLIRLRLLRRYLRDPDSLSGVELAMRWGRPGLRLHFTDGRKVAIATGDADRNVMIGTTRLPGARVHAPSKR